jgi:hypothetical protein
LENRTLALLVVCNDQRNPDVHDSLQIHESEQCPQLQEMELPVVALILVCMDNSF